MEPKTTSAKEMKCAKTGMSTASESRYKSQKLYDVFKKSKSSKKEDKDDDEADKKEERK